MVPDTSITKVEYSSLPKATAFNHQCSHCGRSMEGLFVRALGGYYHLDCFQCLDCAEVVSTKYVSVTGQDGKLYPLCEKDYYRRMRHVCHTCQGLIQGQFITACGKKYHVDHFTCSECSTAFGPNDSYYEHDGKVLCHYHYSLIAATKCSGCEVPIIRKFVETKQNDQNLRWHPECYMISKFWNVKLGPPKAFASAKDGNMTVEDLRREQEKTEVKAQYIWSTLSGFEESSASCISDMLIHVSHGNYRDGVKMAEKFTIHVEILFTAIDRIEAHLNQNEDSLAFNQEPKLLCRKVIGFFSLLSQSKGYIKNPMGIAQELFPLVTGVAHYLKSLIRVALVGALKLERVYGSRTAVSNLLRMLAVHADREKAQQWRMLAKLEADIASELCYFCRETVEERCFRYGKRRWHPNCLRCSRCTRGVAIGHDEATFDANKGVVHCKSCASPDEKTGFKRVTDLDQYSFLLRLSLRRLYALLNSIDPKMDSKEPLPVPKLSAQFEAASQRTLSRVNRIKYRDQNLDTDYESAEDPVNDEFTLTPLPPSEAERAEQAASGPRGRQRSASHVTSIHNLSLLVQAKKSQSISLERQRTTSQGRAKIEAYTFEDPTALSDEPETIENLETVKEVPVKKISYLSQLSFLEFFIVKHLSVLCLAPYVEQFYTMDELLELTGSRKSSFWSRFKAGMRAPNKKADGMFGITLETLTERNGIDSKLGAGPEPLRIPYFVDHMIQVLKTKDMSIEGIFRKNGNIRRLKELIEAIDRNPTNVDLSSENAIQVAALLKKFLNLLPDPLFTFKLYKLFVSIQKLENLETRKKALHLACCLLPRANRDTMECLFVFLKWVSEFANVGDDKGSKMGLSNLATVVTPNILYGNNKDLTKDESFLAIETIDTILNYQDEFWEVPDSVSEILSEVELIEEGQEMLPEAILKRCENYIQSKKKANQQH